MSSKARRLAVTSGTGRTNRALLTAHFGGSTTDDKSEALAVDGVDALRLSAELQAHARDKSPADAKVAARRRGVQRVVSFVLLAAFLAALVWITGGLVGYVGSTAVHTSVSSARTVQLHRAKSAVDCWKTGAATTVWKAAGPAGAIVPYRCGTDALAAIAPGPISTVVVAVAVVDLVAIAVVTQRRRRRAAWY